jgi:hypothetical protein
MLAPELLYTVAQAPVAKLVAAGIARKITDCGFGEVLSWRIINYPEISSIRRGYR